MKLNTYTVRVVNLETSETELWYYDEFSLEDVWDALRETPPHTVLEILVKGKRVW